MSLNVRGSIVMPSRPVPVAGGWATGRKPGIIVYIKGASGRLSRDFERFVKHRGIHATPLGDGAFECIGAVADLERLTEHPAVKDWHLIVSVRPPRFSDGVARDKETGVPQSPMPPAPKNVSVRVTQAVRMRSMSRAERLAVEAREERRLMSADERDAIALAKRFSYRTERITTTTRDPGRGQLRLGFRCFSRGRWRGPGRSEQERVCILCLRAWAYSRPR